MSQYFQYTQTITVPTGGAAYRVWDNPHSTPVKNYSIFVIGPAGADNVTAEIILGGYFTNAGGDPVTPYSSTATLHTSGISQGAAAAIGTVTWASKVIYTNTGIFPANSISSANVIGQFGLPVVVEFKNNNAVDYTLYMCCYGEELGTLV